MTVKLKDLVENYDLEIVHKSSDYDKIIINSSEINRPGLQLCGHFNKFVNERIQVIGTQEWHYLNSLDDKNIKESLNKLFQYNIPCLIFSRNNEVFEEAYYLAKEHDRTLLKSKEPTAKLMSKIVSHIEEDLAPTIRVHGVLLDIYGVGVLIKGRSGIGKSETALDLITNGARLIADDSVIIKNIDQRLIGKSPDITKHFMEIRGVGIIDIQKMYGVGFVMEEKSIEIIINLEDWDESKEYERLGIINNHETLLGIDVAKFDIPVKPGRHTAMIVEVATKNYKQKELGHNPAIELNARILKNKKDNI
ncbi:HPr kinase/phosphorylase [Peptoniphilus olsenii]|uniref:HPr kinase/phosphorylase n=1 Tax=Peptoniphilus olsenii TaxID=411570 RepID=A0ABV2J6K3_9FIRM